MTSSPSRPDPSCPDPSRRDAGDGTVPADRPARADRAETLRFALTYTLPGFAKGFTAPRPGVVSLFGALNQDSWAAATLRALRTRHRGAPALVPGRSGDMLVLLDPADVRQFFDEPVSRLAMDAVDKTRMLSVFEPTGVVCTHGGLREKRRVLNDRALAPDRAAHPSHEEFRSVIAQECAPLTTARRLDQPRLHRAVRRIALRCILGDQAAGDEELLRWMISLRQKGNLGALRSRPAPSVRRLYARAAARLEKYTAHAPAHTLAGRMAAGPCAADTDPVGQIPHWFLAYDATSVTVLRTLLLLGLHPAEQEAVREELPAPGHSPRLRACVQETLRLYPLVPDLLRILRGEAEWRGVRHPVGRHVLAPVWFLQRDPEQLSGAQLFVPGRWLSQGADSDTRMAPFSHGGGRCPGDQLALQTASSVCAELLRTHRIDGDRPALDPHRALPWALPAQGIRLVLSRR